MKFDEMELEDTGRKRSMAIDIVLKKRLSGTCSGGSSGGCSPITPTSVLPELPDNSKDDLFEGFMMQSGDKYTLHRVNKTGADKPPADKKVKLDLDEAVLGTNQKLIETLDVVGERNDLTTLKLRAAKQWLEKSMSHPELSALASPVQPLKIPRKTLPETLERPPQPIELPSVDSTLSAQPATASPILLPQLVPLLSPLPPTNAEVQSISNEVPPQSPPASTIQQNLKGSSESPSVSSDLNVLAAPSPLPSSPKSAQLPPTLSTLRSPLPPSPMISSKGFPPLPLMPSANGAAPPPPPSLGGGTLGQRSASKLKRSSQMGNLYRLLKGKVEGPSLNGKSTRGRRSKVRSGTSIICSYFLHLVLLDPIYISCGFSFKQMLL